MSEKGKLIIIEGIDGSGKATQTKKLVERLRQEGENVETFSFPRHGQKFFGVLVDQYLNNEFGDAATLDPRVSSLFFACDRWEAKAMLDKWLESGKIVVLDRYATSNMGHQISKISDPKKRDEMLDWLVELEFKTFKIPEPDIVIFLDVNVDTVTRLIEQRSLAGKEYIKGKKDGLENNLEHLQRARDTYRYLAKQFDYWHIVDCVEAGQLLPIEKIHERIWTIIKK
ncbi:MAG TPA: dTMP kinase [bacterium]|nr:dTMP kinase [bacterium]